MSTSVAPEEIPEMDRGFPHENAILSDLSEVPTLPNSAFHLLSLSINDKVNANQIITLIKSDPALSVQLVRYAKSAYFGFRGEIESVEQAVVAVLGLRLTINISIGIALGRQFRKSNAGPLGLREYWRHSIFHALLMQGLSSRIPNNLSIHPELAYLCGLLHDFGILVIGHINRRQSILLNEMIKANGEAERIVLEKQILGYCHTTMGACLLQRWNIHPAVIEVAAKHHDEDEQGKYSAYVGLAKVCDYALDAFLFKPNVHAEPRVSTNEYHQLREQLSLTHQDVQEICTHLEIMQGELENMADALIG